MNNLKLETLNPFHHQLIKTLIKDWLLSLIQAIPNTSLLDKDFLIENGLHIQDYITTEQNEFNLLSDKYDLTCDFDVQINDIISITTQSTKIKYQVFYTVINHLKKSIFKWYLSITPKEYSDNFIITSNEYLSQIVHKLNLSIPFTSVSLLGKESKFSSFIKGINLAIKVEGNFLLQNIFHPNLILDQEYFTHQLSNHQSLSKWIYVRFLFDNSNYINKHFKLSYINQDTHSFDTLPKTLKMENRKLPLSFDNSDLFPPFYFKDNSIFLKNDEYPFHLYFKFINGQEKHISHPRNIRIPLHNNLESITITDSLDNDWTLTND